MKRIQSASPPVGGTFSISYKGYNKTGKSTQIITFCITALSLPPAKLREGNVFAGVCLSFYSGEVTWWGTPLVQLRIYPWYWHLLVATETHTVGKRMVSILLECCLLHTLAATKNKWIFPSFIVIIEWVCNKLWWHRQQKKWISC